MNLFRVTVWDTSAGDDPEIWTMESPPVKIISASSFDAASEIARRATPGISIKGMPRLGGFPPASALFKDEFGFVFEVEPVYVSERREEKSSAPYDWEAAFEESTRRQRPFKEFVRRKAMLERGFGEEDI